jgi:hypothetical protein
MIDYELLGAMQSRLACQRQAIRNFTEGTSPSSIRRARYNRFHSYYAPLDGDQWPEDRKDRPNKLHITANIVKAFVDVEARILALLPRITNVPPSKDKKSRLKGEVIEDLNLRWLELSDWEVWMGDWNRLKSLYGKGILRPFWNAADKRPDVRVIEQPQNLMLGYGSSDFTVVDWAIYQYFLSVAEIRRQYPDVVVEDPGGGRPLTIATQVGDHTDPLAQKGPVSSGLGADSADVQRISQPVIRSDYEDRQVEVWDYWYYDAEGKVYNATLVQRTIVDGPILHPEMPRIPYIVCENDHEPGSAEGISTVDGLIDIQMGMNRVLSHFAQLVGDNSGTAYQMTGDNADYVPEGLVPKEDEIIPAGSGNRIEPVMRAVNNFPMQELIKEYWNAAHRITGLPEIMFGNIPSGDTSGRVMAIQIEAGQNRIDSKRRREYNAIRDLLLFWGYMVQKKNPTITVSVPAEVQAEGVNATTPAPDLETKKIKVGDYIKGFERWKIIAPEITPRDSIETAQNVINLVNAKLLPRIEAMDQIGLENPEQMLALIEAEMSNARLNPQDVQAYAGVLQLFQAIVAQQAQNAAMASQEAAQAQVPAQAAAQQAQPTGFEDQNQPMSQPGMAPPPGAGTPGNIGTFEALVRNTPGGQSQSMSQLKLTPRKF